jgi:hypothetical protein
MWPLTEKLGNKIRTVESDCIRSLRMTREHRIRNELCWGEIDVTSSVIMNLESILDLRFPRR